MKTWSELKEVQPLVGKIMVNSIKKNRVSHAYLVQGFRGTGKEALAILFAKTLFCKEKNGIEPCHHCHMCKRISSKNHPDVHWIKPDGLSIKNEQIDSLRKEFSYTALESTRKMYIILHAETLTVNASNRILKFLEEPSVETTALLLTENKQSIIPTIRSRCQVLDLKPLNRALFREQLTELGVSDTNARLLSALTNDAEAALDWNKEDTFEDIKRLVYEFIHIIINDYYKRYLFMHQQWLVQLKKKEETYLALELVLLAFQDVINAKVGNEHLFTFFQKTDTILKQASDYFTDKRLLQILNIIIEARQKLEQHVHPTLVMEQFVLRI